MPLALETYDVIAQVVELIVQMGLQKILQYFVAYVLIKHLVTLYINPINPVVLLANTPSFQTRFMTVIP